MFPLDTTTRAGRMLEAGRVTVTFRSARTGEHITLTAKARGKDEATDKWVGKPLADALVVFIEVPNQEGWNDKVGKVTRRGGFVADPNADEARKYCAARLLDFVAGRPMPDGLEVFEESRCGVCGRQLTDPVSIERGIGPECYGRATGSKHETKNRGGTPAAPSSPVAPSSTEAAAGSLSNRYLAEARSAVAADGAGVPYAVGDWRARRNALVGDLKLETEYLKKQGTARGLRRQLADAEPGASSQNQLFATTGSPIPY